MRDMKLNALASKNNNDVQVSPDNFFVTLNSTPTDKNKTNLSTNFQNNLNTPLLLKGEYEVGLSSIIFSKVTDFELGTVIITYEASEQAYIEKVKISGKMGEDYKSLFNSLNQQISEAIKIREYQRRITLRKLHQVPSNQNVLRTDKHNISLPLKDNKIYDNIVYNEIIELQPQLIYKDNLLTFKTSDKFYLKFEGNLRNIILGLTSDKYDKASQPILIPSKNLPDFNACIITTDIIETEHCGETFLPILGFVSLDIKERAENRGVCKNYNNICYKKVNKDINNIIRTIDSINIIIKTNLNQILSFDQGEVTLRLHFRKINDGLREIL
jgi:hypothetical protein